MRMRLLLMGMVSMHYHIDPVEPALEEIQIGIELKRVRHDTCRIRKHAILGDNSITFDVTRTGHAIIFRQTSHDVRSLRAGSVCLNSFSGLISGTSAGFRPPRSAVAS